MVRMKDSCFPSVMLIFICTHFVEQNYMEVYETNGMGISGVSKKEKKMSITVQSL